MNIWETVALWTLTGVAAAWDLSERRIPNPLILTGLLLGLGFKAQSDGFVGLGLSLLGSFTALLILIVPFAIKRLGGGDVKLAMVCGAFLYWRGAIHVILLASVLHGLMAIGLLTVNRLLTRIGRAPMDLSRLPHAVGFALATVAYTLGWYQLF